MAAGGLAAARHAVPQAVHGFGRRQIGDLEVDRQRDAERAGFRRATITATWTRWRRSSRRISPAIYSNRPPDERTRRPILSPERSLGSVIQLLTPSPEYTDEHNAWLRDASADHPAAAVHREALLPPGMGRQLARAFHGGPHQRLSGARTEVRQPEAGEQLSARGLRSRRLLAHLQAAPDFIPPTKCRWRTTSRPRSCCRARA